MSPCGDGVGQAEFGIRLAAEFVEWHRRPVPGAPLEETLVELAGQDPGDDVFAVVGPTSSLPLVASGFEQLGIARVPGRHLVVRGYADVFERKAFEQAFRDLEKGEREAMYRGRHRHKTTAVLLHELGHNLGAEHVGQPDSMMSAIYSEKASSFDGASHDTMLATIDGRLGRDHRSPPTEHVAEPVVGDDGDRRPPPRPIAEGDHPTLVIEIDARGNRKVGGKVLDDDTLEGLLQLAAKDDRDTSVVIRAATQAPLVAVTRVIDEAKEAGLARFSVERGNGR